MSLKTQLTADMKTAMKAKDQLSLSTIRLNNAAVKHYEVDERVEADDEKVIAILTKMVKQRKDSAKIYAEADRYDLAQKEIDEIEVLNRYLPQMMSEEEIKTAVDTVITNALIVAATDRGADAARERGFPAADRGLPGEDVRGRQDSGRLLQA